jgi:phosphohistidine phosphatase
LQPVASDALLPGAEPDALARELQQRASAGVIALVGHEPHLSGWVSWCLTGSTDGILQLRKGGACLLHFDDIVGPRRGRLLWLMTPAVLRRL